MDENTFLSFYSNTILSCSNNVQRYICKVLEQEHRITYVEQVTNRDDAKALFCESRTDYKGIILKTTMDRNFIRFYEEFEFKKLYKYSVPFFFETDCATSLEDMIRNKGIAVFNDEEYKQEYVIDSTLKGAIPVAWIKGDKIFLKFVLQKVFLKSDTFEQVDYRYPIVLYFDVVNKFLEIRYDAIKFGEQIKREIYLNNVNTIVEWLKCSLGVDLFLCGCQDTISVINNKNNEVVKMYKQMMDMASGASAELTASEGTDYVLPFIGEIRELIAENEDLFNASEEIKQLLLSYLDEKEATASYPYIYVKWVKPVESQSYIVKITFEYFNGRYTLLQHITGNCKQLEMGRMNDAIEYLCQSSSFVKGDKI